MKELKVFFVRHGVSELNREVDFYVGSSLYSTLSPIGINMALSLGKKMAQLGLHFDVTFTSPAVRSMLTARFFWEAFASDFFWEKLTLYDCITDKRLIERQRFSSEGCKKESTPDVKESSKKMSIRMHSFLIEIINRAIKKQWKNIIVFSHGNFMASSFKQLFSLDYYPFVENCGVIELGIQNFEHRSIVILKSIEEKKIEGYDYKIVDKKLLA